MKIKSETAILNEIFNSYKKGIEDYYVGSKVITSCYFKDKDGYANAFFVVFYKNYFVPIFRKKTSWLIGNISMHWDKRNRRYYQAFNNIKEYLQETENKIAVSFQAVYHNNKAMIKTIKNLEKE